MTAIGAVFLPQLPPERLREVARCADDAGLDELWLWEDCFREGGIASAAAALAWTERLRVGVGCVSLPAMSVLSCGDSRGGFRHVQTGTDRQRGPGGVPTGVPNAASAAARPWPACFRYP